MQSIIPEMIKEGVLVHGANLGTSFYDPRTSFYPSQPWTQKRQNSSSCCFIVQEDITIYQVGYK